VCLNVVDHSDQGRPKAALGLLRQSASMIGERSTETALLDPLLEVPHCVREDAIPSIRSAT